MLDLPSLRSDWCLLLQSLQDVGPGETLKRIPGYLRTKLEEYTDGFDRRFGTETSRMVSTSELKGIGPHQEDAVLYWPTRQEEFEQMMKAVGERDLRGFVFVDLGCGKGRVLMMASLLPFKRVLGVDFSPALVDMARKNVVRFRGAPRSGAIDVVNADAAEFPLPEEDLMLFLFNPFGPRVLGRMLENLNVSLRAHPRRTFLLYNNSVHGALVRQAGFELVAEGYGGKWPWQVFAGPA